MRGLSGTVAIVTGGGQGIGRGITLRLAEEGCKVAIFDINPDAGHETAKLAPKSAITTYTVDVGDRASVDRAVAQVEAEIGPIWVLVNNAGWDRPMPFLKTDRDLWDKIIRINLYGPLNTHHAIAPLMVEHGGGRIINIASILGLRQAGRVSPYAISKAGVVQMTKQLGLELARYQIRVNGLAPGYFATEINKGIFENEAGKALIGRIPQGRLGNLSDLDAPGLTQQLSFQGISCFSLLFIYTYIPLSPIHGHRCC